MNEPIRVLQVVAGMDCGGIENFIMEVYRCMERTRVQFDFLYHTGKPCFFDAEITALGGRIYRFPLSEGVDLPRYCAFLDGFFAAHPEYTVIHGHYSLFGVFYSHYAKKHGVAVRVGHSHTTRPVGSGLNGLADRVLTPLFRIGLTHRFACSQAAGRYLFGRQPFQVLANGIRPQRFVYSPALRAQVRAAYGIPAEAYVVGSVGQLRPEKHQLWLVRQLAALHRQSPEKEVWLLLVGDGSQREPIVRAAQQAGLAERLVLAGQQQDTAPFYSAMDAFALPSRFEGLGIALVEAQANGLPCLASTGVPREADLTGNVTFLALENDGRWPAALAAPGSRIADGAARVAAAGYDIAQTAHWLMDFYLAQTKPEGKA